jgi:hypothetical protein
MELRVPIFQGRIDKTLFLSALREAQQQSSGHEAQLAGA